MMKSLKILTMAVNDQSQAKCTSTSDSSEGEVGGAGETMEGPTMVQEG